VSCSILIRVLDTRKRSTQKAGTNFQAFGGGFVVTERAPKTFEFVEPAEKLTKLLFDTLRFQVMREHVPNSIKVLDHRPNTLWHCVLIEKCTNAVQPLTESDAFESSRVF
jgi:hypothetical protein